MKWAACAGARGGKFLGCVSRASNRLSVLGLNGWLEFYQSTEWTTIKRLNKERDRDLDSKCDRASIVNPAHYSFGKSHLIYSIARMRATWGARRGSGRSWKRGSGT